MKAASSPWRLICDEPEEGMHAYAETTTGFNHGPALCEVSAVQLDVFGAVRGTLGRREVVSPVVVSAPELVTKPAFFIPSRNCREECELAHILYFVTPAEGQGWN